MLSTVSALVITLVYRCRMRWTVRGIPRVPWNAEGVFDGVSTFRLDRKGMIYEHQASITSIVSPF